MARIVESATAMAMQVVIRLVMYLSLDLNQDWVIGSHLYSQLY